jgi:hypothetical protein
MPRVGDEHDGRSSDDDSGRGDGPNVYVYGIVPSDVETTPDAEGIGDPPTEVLTIRHEAVAALVSLIDRGMRLGRAEDLTAHEALLDDVAVHAPVLPLRFGAVMTGEVAVADELLAVHHDGFAAALERFEGKAEFVIRGRYRRSTVLREILADNQDLVRRRDAIHGKPATATHRERVAIGQRITTALAAKREKDTQLMVRALTDLGARVSLREPSHHDDAVYVACLVDLTMQAVVESLVGQFALAWSDRVSLRLLGPLAPYDFVAAKPGA